jgi:hypothetical protein
MAYVLYYTILLENYYQNIKSLEGIPLLVLGNKNDIKGSLNEEELVN